MIAKDRERLQKLLKTAKTFTARYDALDAFVDRVEKQKDGTTEALYADLYEVVSNFLEAMEAVENTVADIQTEIDESE